MFNYIRYPLLGVALSAITLGQTSKAQQTLFPADKTCAPIETRIPTADLISTEVHIGKTIYQVFTSRATNRELFRVAIGTDEAKYWTYGVVKEGDFNGDGVEDFLWYGGDDTSDEMVVFLSSAQGYRELDVYATLSRFWVRKFHKPAPNFAGQDKVQVKDIAFVRCRDGLWLAATADPGLLSPGGPQSSIKVPQAEFVYR